MEFHNRIKPPDSAIKHLTLRAHIITHGKSLAALAYMSMAAAAPCGPRRYVPRSEVDPEVKVNGLQECSTGMVDRGVCPCLLMARSDQF